MRRWHYSEVRCLDDSNGASVGNRILDTSLEGKFLTLRTDALKHSTTSSAYPVAPITRLDSRGCKAIKCM